MKLSLIISIVIVLSAALLVTAESIEKGPDTLPDDQCYHLQNPRVYDGDTIYGGIWYWPHHSTYVGVRLIGVDTPEMGPTGCGKKPLAKLKKVDRDKWGKALRRCLCERRKAKMAKNFVKRMVDASEVVYVCGVKTGSRPGRIAARVMADTTHIAKEVIKAGHGVSMGTVRTQRWCSELE